MVEKTKLWVIIPIYSYGKLKFQLRWERPSPTISFHEEGWTWLGIGDKATTFCLNLSASVIKILEGQVCLDVLFSIR